MFHNKKVLIKKNEFNVPVVKNEVKKRENLNTCIHQFSFFDMSSQQKGPQSEVRSWVSEISNMSIKRLSTSFADYFLRTYMFYLSKKNN